MKAKNIIWLVSGTALILLVPLVAMQFSNEVNWNWFDFAVIGILLFGAGLMFELVKTRVSTKYRALVAVLLVVAVCLIWVELAVGILGSPIAGN